MDNRDKLSKGVEKIGLLLEQDKQEKLLAFLGLMEKWNKTYNLTAIRDPAEMVSNHLLDTLAIVPYLWPKNWLDVGCGGGVPGLVLAITRPEWNFTLLDSNSKKTSFVQQAIIDLELRNAKVRCERVENWHPEVKFDGIISRAFTELGDFIEKTRHLKAENGHWAAMKGAPEKELQGIPKDCRIEKNIPIEVPGLDAARSLIIATCEG